MQVENSSPKSRVIIAGGNGLIGERLSRNLQAKGYDVGILSRNPRPDSPIPSYSWNIDHQKIDREAINNCDFIIHLAGANIGAKRWSSKRKKVILDSRTRSIDLLFNNLDTGNKRLKAFISASAIGYYGAHTSEHIFSETDQAAIDYLGLTCSLWEQAAEQFTELDIRTVKIRTGIVLSKKGGALSKLILPVKLGLASAIGSGKQYMPWIHLDDLCDIYIQAIENQALSGAYNAVSPEHLSNKEFTRKIAQTLHKPFWFPSIPAKLMKLLFGEMSLMLLKGSRVSSEKIQAAGFKFRYPQLDTALKSLLSK